MGAERVVISTGGGRVAISGRGATWMRNPSGLWSRGARSEAAISPDGRLVALVEEGGALLRVEEINNKETIGTWRLKRAPRRVRFCPSSHYVLVADRGGAAFAFDLLSPSSAPTTIAGHAGALLDVALVGDGRVALTCDRDEKIRACRFPSTRDVLAYCLGHNEYVGAVEPLPHDSALAVSASGDGTVRIWEAATGREVAFIDVDARAPAAVRSAWSRAVEEAGATSSRLPVEAIACGTQIDSASSFITIALRGVSEIMVYRASPSAENIQCEFISAVATEGPPVALAIDEINGDLWACLETEGLRPSRWSISTAGLHRLNPEGDLEGSAGPQSSLSDLFPLKRRIDGVGEYLERKNARIESQR